jgi:hypothetical protein
MVNDSKKKDRRFHIRQARSGALGGYPTPPVGAIIVTSKDGASGTFQIMGVTIHAKVRWRDDDVFPEEGKDLPFLFFPGVEVNWSASHDKRLRLCVRFGPLDESQVEHIEEICSTVRIDGRPEKHLGIDKASFPFDFTRRPFWVVIEEDTRVWIPA